MKTSICLFLAVIIFTSVAVAQSTKDKIEIGVQSTSLTLFDADFPVDFTHPACLSSDVIHTEPGFGTRFTFNITDYIALEVEGNFFTREILDLPNPSGYMFRDSLAQRPASDLKDGVCLAKLDRGSWE